MTPTTTPSSTGAESHGRDRLGTGWAFPIRPDAGRGPRWLSGADLVRQSVLLVLSTEPGERVMRPVFGCGLGRYVAEPNTPATRARMAGDIETALRTWEPRIEVEAVTVEADPDPAVAVVTVRYSHVRDGAAAVLELPYRFTGAL